VLANLQAFGFSEVTLMSSGETSIKNRYMDIKSRRCLLRVDQDVVGPSIGLPGDLDRYDAVVISDYNKGSVDMGIIQDLVQRYPGPIFADTKIRDLASLKGCILKINLREWNLRTSDHDDVVVTQGEQGATYRGKLYPARPADVHVVCGAGDTFLAALVAGWLQWQDMEPAIGMALRASSLAVQNLGTWSPTPQQAEELCGY
jgi:D-beta-D-heptose 7-phosphate kinase/D-beta-D-heptose 1-phosphate adenosyltransferase